MAGAGYKLFNTGDVLTAAQVNTYLQEQVVMVFANAAARTTALSGVLAEGMITYLKDTDLVETYNGSTWVSVAAGATPLTTKGDLYTYSTTNARLAVGNNGDSLRPDSSTTTGLRWQEPKALNPVINSAFQVWQRGTSITPTASTYTYTADRWQWDSANSCTISRQATGDTTNLPNIQYCARVQRNSGQTSLSNIYLHQPFESASAIPFAGKTVTLSFYARSGADFSAASSTLKINLSTGTGTDQNARSGSYTGLANPINTTVTLTTTWQRFSVTGTFASTITECDLIFFYTPTGTAGTNDYYEITGVQLEVGSVATPFKTQGATLAAEIALCQRYLPAAGTIINSKNTYPGYAYGTNTSVYNIPLPVKARVAPTGMTVSGTINAYALNVATAVTPTFNDAGTDICTVLATPTITAGDGSRLELTSGATLLFTGSEIG